MQICVSGLAFNFIKNNYYWEFVAISDTLIWNKIKKYLYNFCEIKTSIFYWENI